MEWAARRQLIHGSRPEIGDFSAKRARHGHRNRRRAASTAADRNFILVELNKDGRAAQRTAKWLHSQVTNAEQPKRLVQAMGVSMLRARHHRAWPQKLDLHLRENP